MVESVFTAGEGDRYKTELLNSLHRATPTLRIVTVGSGRLCLRWTAEAMGTMDN